MVEKCKIFVAAVDHDATAKEINDFLSDPRIKITRVTQSSTTLQMAEPVTLFQTAMLNYIVTHITVFYTEEESK